MTNKDFQDNFLDKLYAQSANEKPPADLDKIILEEAKAKHKPPHFLVSMKLQRVLSVAAVMVLSVYIFFDVDGHRSTGLDAEWIYPQNNDLHSSPSAPQSESFRMTNKAQTIKKSKSKETKKLIKREAEDYAADDMSESGAGAQGLLESDMAAPQFFSAPTPSFHKRDTDVEHELKKPSIRNIAEGIKVKNESKEVLVIDRKSVLENAVKSRNQKQGVERQMSLPTKSSKSNEPEEMLTEVERLISKGELEKAKAHYHKLKLLFPEYPIPTVIADSVE